jgi:glycosyltransferase involved in cell wall biosynthesis
MMRLVILDPGLTTVLSHNYSEANALVREARNLHLTTKIVCHRDAHKMVQKIPADPFFQQHSYGHMEDLRPAADFMAINFCNQATLKDLELLTATVNSDDFVFFPTVTCNIVLAICQWLNHFAPANTPRFGLCFMFPPDTNTAFRPSAVASDTYRQAFALIPTALADRLVYTCEIDALSQTYEALLGTRPITLSIPTWAFDAEQPSRTNEMRISFLGGGRAEKGFHLLPEVISIVRKRYPATRFTVQAVGYETEFVNSVTSKLIMHQDVLTLIETPISDEHLRTAMKSSSVLLMPYDREKYKKRGSSLFTEAQRMGIPMVLPAGTEIGEDGLRKGNAVTFVEFNAQSVANAVVQAIDRWEQLSQAASQVALSKQVRCKDYLAVLLHRLGCLS